MVIFAGARTVDIEKEKNKYVLVRRSMLRALTAFFLKNSPVYTRFKDKANDTLIDALPECSNPNDNIIEVAADSHLLQESIGNSDRANNGGIEFETHLELASGLFMLEDRTPGEGHDRPVTLPGAVHPPVVELPPHNPTVDDSMIPSSTVDDPMIPSSPLPTADPVPATTGRLRITTGISTIMSHKDKAYYPSSQPHLFPYGIGCPNALRDTPCSRFEAIRHTLRKQDERQFAKDVIYCLDCFSCTAKDLATVSLFIRLKSNPANNEAALHVNADQLKRLVAHNLERSRCAKIGKDVRPLPPELASANRVMRCLESAAHYTYGTKEERLVMTDIVSGYINVS
jgi:hypothetical protein